MEFSKETLEKLRDIINGDDTIDYRSGSDLIAFFNELGFENEYGRGFPSRHAFTDAMLEKINGTELLFQCVKNTFRVVKFANRIEYLDKLIAGFNDYLRFDMWEVKRENASIKILPLETLVIPSTVEPNSESETSTVEQFNSINLEPLCLNDDVTQIINERISEAIVSLNNNAPLAAVILIGSSLEGILFGIAKKFPEQFNRANSAPREHQTAQVKSFDAWKLNDYINVANEIGVINSDTQVFSHAIREFRNYIHPFKQLESGFNPDKNTATLCYKALEVAVEQICEYNNLYTNH